MISFAVLSVNVAIIFAEERKAIISDWNPNVCVKNQWYFAQFMCVLVYLFVEFYVRPVGFEWF